MKHLFGPVPSRRLGLSLGVDLVPYKVCSFDCVYCECGRTTIHTTKRAEYVPCSEVIEELEELLKNPPELHYITFSGFGEPTLNIGFGKVARWIREHTQFPLALLTNSSLLVHPEVRKEASLCTVVLPSLDAARQETFLKINRPAEGIEIKEIIRALKDFKREHPSVRMDLEVLFVKDYNDQEEEIKELKKAIEFIEPDGVHLNTVDRPPAEKVEPVDIQFLKEVKSYFGGNTKIVGFGEYETTLELERLKDAVLAVIQRRPLRETDIAKLTGQDIRMVAKLLDALKKDDLVEEVHFESQCFFKARGGSACPSTTAKER